MHVLNISKTGFGNFERVTDVKKHKRRVLLRLDLFIYISENFHFYPLVRRIQQLIVQYFTRQF